MGDETYLESFIESIATLPHDVRRNLELMKDMDKSCSALVEELTHAEQDYVQRAEEKVMQLELGKTKDGRDGVVRNGNGAVIPTTQELSAFVEDAQALSYIQNLRQSAMQHSSEKAAIAEQTYKMVNATVKRLDHDLATLEKLLKATGEFESAGGGKPDDLAAIQVNPASSDWILAKVMTHDTSTGMYTLSDEDADSNKVYHLPESQVVVLGGVEKLSRGDVIYAVYPDTTSFYQATVVHSLRKTTSESFVLVNFVDDSDEHGVTHDKGVLLKHVMRPPYGAAIQ